jgi:hypothetical protein
MKGCEHDERRIPAPALPRSIAGRTCRAAGGRARGARSGTGILLGLLGLCAAAAVSADTTLPPEPATFLSLGPAVEITPTYPGASTSRTFALPDVEAQYDNWLYMSAGPLGRVCQPPYSCRSRRTVSSASGPQSPGRTLTTCAPSSAYHPSRVRSRGYRSSQHIRASATCTANALPATNFSSRWALGLDVTVARLQGDAADSPFSPRRARRPPGSHRCSTSSGEPPPAG